MISSKPYDSYTKLVVRPLTVNRIIVASIRVQPVLFMFFLRSRSCRGRILRFDRVLGALLALGALAFYYTISEDEEREAPRQQRERDTAYFLIS